MGGICLQAEKMVCQLQKTKKAAQLTFDLNFIPSTSHADFSNHSFKLICTPQAYAGEQSQRKQVDRWPSALFVFSPCLSQMSNMPDTYHNVSAGQ